MRPLFVGWGRLLAFVAGDLLVLTNASVLASDDAFGVACVHAVLATLAAVWFTVELIWVPEAVFGEIVPNTSLIRVLRVPWRVAVGMLGLLASSLVVDAGVNVMDLSVRTLWLQYVGILVSASSFVLALSVLVWTPNKEATDWSTPGWRRKRWYERKAADIVPRHPVFGYALGAALLVCPAVSLALFVPRLVADGVSVATGAPTVAVLGVDLVLLWDAVLFARAKNVVPLHLGSVLAQWFVVVASVQPSDTALWLLAGVAPLVSYAVVEGYCGQTVAFLPHANAVLYHLVNYERVVYRFCYVAAVWCGVVAAVAWGLGWSGDWIAVDVEHGDVVRSVLDMLESLEDAIRGFLLNLVRVLNKLNVPGCEALPEYRSLTDSSALDGDDDDDVGTHLAAAIAATTVLGNMTVSLLAESGVAGFRPVRFQFRDRADVPLTQYAECTVKDACFLSTDAEPCDDGDYTLLRDVYRGETTFGDHVALRAALQDADTCTLETKLVSEDEKDAKKADEETSAELDTVLDKTDTEEGALGVLERPEDCATCVDPDAWEDPSTDLVAQDKGCRDAACYLFIAAMAAATGMSLVPILGGAASAVAKTAIKIAWKLFRTARKFAYKFKRLNAKRKAFRRKRQALLRWVNDGIDQIKEGVPTTTDLVYTFLPLFGVSFVSIFVGFWKRRTPTPSARAELRAGLMSAVVANGVCMGLVHGIPTALRVVAAGLPDALLKVSVRTKSGWWWMVVSSGASCASCVFWGIAIFLGQHREAKHRGKGNVVAPVAARRSRWIGASPRAKAGSPAQQWLSMLIWLLPVLVLVLYALVDSTPVFVVVTRSNPEVLKAVGDVQAQEGIQGSLDYERDVGGDNVCDLVAKGVSIAFGAAAKAVGQGILAVAKTLLKWFQQAFYWVRKLMTALVDIPNLDVPDATQLLLLGVLFGCPSLALLLSAVGALVGWTCNRSNDHWFAFVLQLGMTGLSVSMTVAGFAAVVESVKLPLLNVRVETTALITQSVLANILVLVSYANRVFDGLVPLKNA